SSACVSAIKSAASRTMPVILCSRAATVDLHASRLLMGLGMVRGRPRGFIPGRCVAALVPQRGSTGLGGGGLSWAVEPLIPLHLAAYAGGEGDHDRGVEHSLLARRQGRANLAEPTREVLTLLGARQLCWLRHGTPLALTAGP